MDSCCFLRYEDYFQPQRRGLSGWEDVQRDHRSANRLNTCASQRLEVENTVRNLTISGTPPARLVEDLTARKSKADRRRSSDFVHLDPDLRRDSLRESGLASASRSGKQGTDAHGTTRRRPRRYFYIFRPIQGSQEGLDGSILLRRTKQHVLHGWQELTKLYQQGHRSKNPWRAGCVITRTSLTNSRERTSLMSRRNVCDCGAESSRQRWRRAFNGLEEKLRPTAPGA